MFLNFYETYGKVCTLAPKASSYARSGSRTAATSKMEHFVIIVNDWKKLIIITIGSILDVVASLDPPLLGPGNLSTVKPFHIKKVPFAFHYNYIDRHVAIL